MTRKVQRRGLSFIACAIPGPQNGLKWAFQMKSLEGATGHKSLEAYQQYVKLDPSAVMRLVETKRYKNGIKTAESVAI